MFHFCRNNNFPFAETRDFASLRTFGKMNALRIEKTTSAEVSALRELFLKEGGIQFIHNKCHRYGWADIYLFSDGKTTTGYGAVWGKDNREDRDTVFEFYLLPEYRRRSVLIFDQFVKACNVPFMECQTNDFLLASIMFECAQEISTQSILFADHTQTRFDMTGVTFKKQPYPTNHADDYGGYVLELEGEVAASGGFMLNYNHPYADIYMDVKEPYRQRGLGSLMVQELKKEIYKAGRVPAARCNVSNGISKATLLKAGFRVCGYLLEGKIKK